MNFLLVSSLLLSACLGSPLIKRAATMLDADILQLALTLENLEFALYTQATEQATAGFFPYGPNFTSDLKDVATNEADHISLISTALSGSGIKPNSACTYAFNYSTPAEFLALSIVVTQVGVGAYSGAIPLFQEAVYEKSSIAILPIESRHNAFFRVNIPLSPNPIGYDTALSARQAFTLASPLIVSCPATNMPLFVTSLPALMAPMMAKNSETITLTYDEASCGQAAVAVWQNGLDIIYTGIAYTGTGMVSTIVPPSIGGCAFVSLVSCDTAVDAASIELITIAGPAAVVIS